MNSAVVQLYSKMNHIFEGHFSTSKRSVHSRMFPHNFFLLLQNCTECFLLSTERKKTSSFKCITELLYFLTLSRIKEFD